MNKTSYFYDKFHKFSKPSYKLISENNITYYLILKLIKETLSKNKVTNILDYGCGSGALSLFLGALGKHVVGVDISNKAISSANTSAVNLQIENNAQFYNLSEGNKRINNSKFDLILCIEVLEHIKDDDKLLIRLKSLLSRGGIIIISVPSLNAPLFKLGLLKKFDKRVGHLRRYSEESLISLAKRSNLQIVSITKSEGLLRNSLYTLTPLGFILKFIKGHFVVIFTFIDNITLKLFGESDIAVIVKNV